MEGSAFSYIVLGSVVTAILGLLTVIIRQIGPWRKQVSDAEDHLRGELLRRVAKLERRLETKEAIHKAERSLDRHRLNNVTQCFDALLLLIEMAPDKASEAVQKIKTMRETQLRAEAEEKAIVRAAEIAATEQETEDEKAAQAA